MAKKRKSSTTRSSALEPEDDSEDEWEEIVEPSGEDPENPTQPTADTGPPTYGATSEEDWHPASESPPSSAPVDIETSGEVVTGYKHDGVWYQVSEPNEDGSVPPDVAVQITRWKA